MPFLAAYADPNHGYIYLETNWGDTPAAQYVKIMRTDTTTGVTTVVRTNTATDATGDFQELSGGRAILYDVEAPLDTPVSYAAYQVGATTPGVVTPDLILSSGGVLWIKNPTYPGTDQRMWLKLPPSPGCVPPAGLAFVSMDEETYQPNGALNQVVNRRTPTSVVRVRGGISSTLNIATRTFGDRDAVVPQAADRPGESLTGPGTALLLQAPGQYGIPDRVLDVGTPTVTKGTTDTRLSWRLIALPHTEVDRATGPAYGVAGTRWADLCAPYATFGAATAAGLTWLGVVQGRGDGATESVTTNWRTYAQETAQFATYSVVIASGRTYRDMTEGR